MRFPLLRRRKRAEKSRVPLPPDFPKVAGLQVAGIYTTSRMGGDFFDFVHAPNGCVVLLLMDVAGERDSAFKIVADVQQIFRERSEALFADEGINESEAISELALAIGRGILTSANGPRCTPAFLASYSPAIGTFTYVNAGHVPGFVVEANDISQLPSTGLPLGLFSHVVHDAQFFALGEGDAFVIASRGVVEAGANDGDFGIDGIRAALTKARLHSATELCNVVLRMAMHHSGSTTPANDMTAVALLREAHATAGEPREMGAVA